ncbi:MAG: hypothetical protein ACYDHY_07615 [Acidiferrobacterales bacterium]
MSEDIHSLRVPFFCPICRSIMRGSRCNSSYYSWGCCVDCVVQFVEGREQRWKDGWRPSEEEVKVYKERLNGA